MDGNTTIHTSGLLGMFERKHKTSKMEPHMFVLSLVNENVGRAFEGDTTAPSRYGTATDTTCSKLQRHLYAVLHGADQNGADTPCHQDAQQIELLAGE